MKIPELRGNWSVLKVRRITWKTKKTSRKQNGKVPSKILKNILVVRREKTYGETGGNYLLKPTGNDRHFAGRYSWWTPRQKIPSLTDFYLVTNCFFPVLHELTTWNTGLGTGSTSPSWVSQWSVTTTRHQISSRQFGSESIGRQKDLPASKKNLLTWNFDYSFLNNLNFVPWNIFLIIVVLSEVSSE